MDNRDIDFNEKTVRELIPGIILYKEPSIIENIPNSLGMFIIKIEVATMCTLDLELSLKDSKNMKLLTKSDDMCIKVKINPYEKKEIARIVIFEGWKIQTKFKMSLCVPDKNIQKNFIEDDNKQILCFTAICEDKIKKYPLELMNQKEIEELFNKFKLIKFVDINFPPNDERITSNQDQKLSDNYEYLVHWKRPEQFILMNHTNIKRTSNQQINIFNFKEPLPNGINIGLMENHNYISSISGLAEKQNLINRIIVQRKTNKYGVYQIKLYIRGMPKIIVIDDLFPCIPSNNPIVTHSPSNEIWTLLVEKALAKEIGSYSLLIFLSMIEYFLILTGCPSFYYEISELIKDNENELIYKLKYFIEEKKYLTMAVTMFNEDQNEDEDKDSPIIPNFAYTILGLINLNDILFIKLRKIWYNEEKEKIIQEYEQILFEKNFELQRFYNPYEIILALEDFINYFSVITVCYTKNWEEVRIKSKFSIEKENEASLYKICLSENYYCMYINSNTNVIISIFQNEDFIKCNDSIKPIIDISLTVLLYNTSTGELFHKQTLDFNKSQSVQQELVLEKGVYIILPRSSGCFMAFKNDANVYTDIMYEKENKQFTSVFISVLKDIFNSYDKKNKGVLYYETFKSIYSSITSKNLSKNEFDKNIICKYQSYKNGITEIGFIEFIKDYYKKYGESNIRNFLSVLGYDNTFFNRNNRDYNIVIHSDQKILVKVNNLYGTEINTKINNLILKNFGEINDNIFNDEYVKAILVKSKISNIITLGCKNISNKDLKVKITFNYLDQIILGTTNNEYEKTIKKNEVEFFCQFFIEDVANLNQLNITVKY